MSNIVVQLYIAICSYRYNIHIYETLTENLYFEGMAKIMEYITCIQVYIYFYTRNYNSLPNKTDLKNYLPIRLIIHSNKILIQIIPNRMTPP